MAPNKISNAPAFKTTDKTANNDLAVKALDNHNIPTHQNSNEVANSTGTQRAAHCLINAADPP